MTKDDGRKAEAQRRTLIWSFVVRRSSALPDDDTGFSASDAHGARNAGGYSIAQRLHVGAFDKRDQIISAGNSMNLFDH